MVVNYVRKPDGVYFSHLLTGQAFRIEGCSDLFMRVTKIEDRNKVDYNTVNLCNGRLSCTGLSYIVYPCDDAQVVNKQ